MRRVEYHLFNPTGWNWIKEWLTRDGAPVCDPKATVLDKRGRQLRRVALPSEIADIPRGVSLTFRARVQTHNQ